MAKRICLISPGHVAFNPRLVKEADALSTAGYDVHVIAANNLERLRSLDQPILAAAKWTFELVGSDGAVLDFLRRGRSRLAREALTRWSYDHIRLYEWAHHNLIDLLKAAAKRQRADLYVAHYVAALPAAHWAARQHGARWTFDAEDYHMGQFSADELGEVSARAVSAIERAYLNSAEYFTAASGGIAAAYRRTYSLPLASVVLNVFPRANAPLEPTRAGTVQPGPSLYWFSQTVGVNRGLECAIRAIALADSKPHLYMRGNLQTGIERRLENIAKELGISDRIHFQAPVPGSEMERLAAEYDVGLAGEPGYTENNRIAVANKLFSYLLAGLPVMASDTEGHLEIAAASAAISIYPADNAEKLAAALDRLLLNPEALTRARHDSWEVAQSRYNWDIEQAKIINAVATLIGRPTYEQS
jgi:glycosyltransferase involved in cell wall biosynthesis